MHRTTIMGLTAAFVVFLALCYNLSGAPDNAGFLETINPADMFNGLAFAAAFGFGVPTPLAYLLAAAVLLAPSALAFFVVRKFSSRFVAFT